MFVTRKIIGASLSEPHNCWCLLPLALRACVRTCVRTWRRQMSGSECGVRCLRTSTVSSEIERTSVWTTWNLNTYTAPELAGERSRATASTEDGQRLWRTSAKGQERGHGSGEAIITKKRFVPEKFLHVAMKVAWTAVGYGCGLWAI